MLQFGNTWCRTDQERYQFIFWKNCSKKEEKARWQWPDLFGGPVVYFIIIIIIIIIIRKGTLWGTTWTFSCCISGKRTETFCLSLDIILHETISWWTVNKNHIAQENAMFNITLTRKWIYSQIFYVSWSNILLHHWNAVLCRCNQLKTPVKFVGFGEF